MRTRRWRCCGGCRSTFCQSWDRPPTLPLRAPPQAPSSSASPGLAPSPRSSPSLPPLSSSQRAQPRGGRRPWCRRRRRRRAASAPRGEVQPLRSAASSGHSSAARSPQTEGPAAPPAAERRARAPPPPSHWRSSVPVGQSTAQATPTGCGEWPPPVLQRRSVACHHKRSPRWLLRIAAEVPASRAAMGLPARVQPCACKRTNRQANRTAKVTLGPNLSQLKKRHGQLMARAPDGLDSPHQLV